MHFNEYTQLNERKILLLGSSPLISHIALNLLADKENWLTIMDRKPPNMIFENPELQQYQGSRRIADKIHCSAYDLDNVDRKFNEFDVIINHYCIHDSKYSTQNPSDTYNTNVVFTNELMQKLIEDDFNGVLLHLSTAKVYGFQSDADQIQRIPETMECKPKGVKAESRYAQEQLVRSYCEKHSIKNLIFRLGTLIGKFTPLEGMINQWVLQGLNKDDYHVYGIKDVESKESRDFTNIHDIGIFIKDLVESLPRRNKEIYYETYNLGGNHRYEARIQNYHAMIKRLFSAGDDWPGSMKTIYHGYRNVDSERHLRIWLDTVKAEKKLGYGMTYGVYAQKLFPDIALFLAYNALSWNDLQMYKLERIFGIFNEQRRTKLINAGLINEKGPSSQVATNIDNFMNNRYVGM